DAVMTESAIREEMDCIVTRNLGDYKKAALPVYSPEVF
ncbi:MAG: PIN domain-containing protein, partial [Dorea sp.]|nr:PIN domain-containing protein [Dorea sp.]